MHKVRLNKKEVTIWVEEEVEVEAVGKAAAGAAGVVRVSAAGPKQLARAAIVSAPTAGTRCPIKLGSLVLKSSAPNAAQT